MPTWGLSATGFYRPRFDEIVTEMESRWKARFGANRNTRADSTDGKIIRVIAEGLALNYEAIEGAYQASFLDTSSGESLDLWAAGISYLRQEATRSTVTLTLGGTPGTVVPSGSIVTLTSGGSSGRRWTTDASATIGGGGTIAVAATAEETGPIAATSGSTWSITTPVSGWSTVTNALDAELGQDEETDAELRQRIRDATAEGGVKAEILDDVDGVEQVTIFENDTDIPDPLYNATHWVEALVVGGDDQEIANAIWRAKPEGIGTQGDTMVTETVTGDENEVRFSRGTERDIWVTVAITAAEGFSGNATEIRNALVTWGNANHEHGDDVAPAMLAAQVPLYSVGRYSVSVLIGTSNPPGSSAILTIPDREIARFDTSRTVVTIT